MGRERDDDDSDGDNNDTLLHKDKDESTVRLKKKKEKKKEKKKGLFDSVPDGREGRREWGSDGGDHSRWRKATFMKLLRRCYDLPQEVSSTLIGS